jgi:hypothetical protein
MSTLFGELSSQKMPGSYIKHKMILTHIQGRIYSLKEVKNDEARRNSSENFTKLH